MTTRKMRVLVVDDESKILEHVSNKIEAADDAFEVVGKASNGEEALERIAELRPHIVFTDISMPIMNGIELIKKIKQQYPHIFVVILSGYSDFQYAQQAIRYGAFSYLLKPTEENFEEVLSDLKQALEVSKIQQKRKFIYSHDYQITQEEPFKFQVALICIGNYICIQNEEEIQKQYKKEVETIPWNIIMEELCSEGREWFVADDQMINQKVVTVKMPFDVGFGSKKFHEQLLATIRKHTSYPVNIYTTRVLIEQEALWDEVKGLREYLRRTIVIGKSNLAYLDKKETEKINTLDMIKTKINMSVKTYSITKNVDELYTDVKAVIKYLRANQCPQRNVKIICVHMIKLLELSDVKQKPHLSEEREVEVLKVLSVYTSEEVLFEKLLAFMKRIIFQDVGQDGYREEDVVAYVDENFLTIASVEEVADLFGYNYTYFSRMFKQKVGMSLNQYITAKKISMAKELMKNQPDLNIQEVSSLCGYADKRYFSRVFKSESGMSPSEYQKGNE